mgnify:CR=1 FL=1
MPDIFTLENKIKQIIDDLKGLCSTNGLSNQASEEVVITSVFLYKFLNDKFMSNLKEFAAELDMDYKDVLKNPERYAPSAIAPFTFGNGIYAVPETQDFFMTFYRTDILEEIGLEPPETWNDVYNIIGHLQNQQMTFAMPVPVVGAVGSGNLSFAMLLYQKGGQYYTADRDSTDLNSDAALDAFKEWTEFYTLYNLPNTYDFANRFRTGEMPIGIGGADLYVQLLTAAPELTGKWTVAAIPGKEKADGSIDIMSVLVKAGMTQSRSEARRAVEQGGVTVNGEKVTDIKTTYAKDTFAEEFIIKKGKKSFNKIVL